MLSIGIIWNSANNLKDDILKDVGEQANLLEYFEIDLGSEYVEFVNAIYKSENMESWKIENKLAHMLINPNTKITILFFEFDSKDVSYHPFKKKNVFVQLENCKAYIRNKYKDKLPNYTFDIIFHATDSLEELKNCFNVIVPYLKKKQLNNQKVLRLTQHKDNSKVNNNE